MYTNLLKGCASKGGFHRGIARISSRFYSVGDIIHGYRLEKTDHIKELNIRPYYLRHQATGSEHLHIHKEGDSNNLFAVSLRTTPKNSNGVAHILEHLALTGSKRYNVRDAFMMMTSRSLATFMNAFTSCDWTMYPFSTQNKQDFENLLRVYLDAVFFPSLRPALFRQEGWRLEHEKHDNKDTPIIIKGVVYNEMKGAFSASSQIYMRMLQNKLFPDTTYQHESGGDPSVIPSLKHEDLVKFYKLHYHPSNAKFMTYGDFPMEEHLRLLDELALSKFSENTDARETSFVPEQVLWKEAQSASITCPYDPLCPNPEKQTTTSISYILPTLVTNLEDLFSLQILSSLLLDGPNAPFYKSLIESGLGSDYSPSTGLATHTKQPYLSVGLQNIHPDDVSKVHAIIQETFERSAKEGFPQERIDAILHDIELSLKHISGNFGLKLALGVESIWNHDGDPIDYLRVNKYVDLFKKSLANDKNFWSNMIAKYFLNNKHKLMMTMHPDPTYEDKRKEAEKKLNESLVSELDETQKQTIYYEGLELAKIQNSKDDPNILPCLDPSKDISRDLPNRVKLNLDEHKGVHIQLCEQPTNEVVYFRALLDVGDKLNQDGLIQYLPLFCDVATKLGAGLYDRQQLSQKMQLTTGGLGVTHMLNPDLGDVNKFKNQLYIGSHCLKRNTANMFDLWTNVFKEIHFTKNKEFLYQLVKASAADLADGVSHSGNRYAKSRASSGLSEVARLEEELSGLEYLACIKDIASIEPVEDIVKKLSRISEIILDPFQMKCAINAEPEVMQSTVLELKKFVDGVQMIHNNRQVPSDSSVSIRDPTKATKVDDMKFPFACHYVAKSLMTVPRLHNDFAKLVVMAQLISKKYLLREVREKGGAYGAALGISTNGIMSFSSYRDPETEKTLIAFDRAADWVEREGSFSERDVQEAILSVFQGIDKPVDPGRRGIRYFTTGETDDIREEYRRNILDVTSDDVKEVAHKYLRQEKAGTYIL